MSATSYQAMTMVIYLSVMVLIGFFAYLRTTNLDDFMLGGRGLGPFVAALSAGASDMSGWLLMGLPGAIYSAGLINMWIAVGLTIGAWLNWKYVAPRLRAQSEVMDNSITIPSFLSNRVQDQRNIIRITAGLIILLFFTFYVSSGIVSGAVFFQSSFGMDYRLGLVLVTAITVLYTLIGGFLAVSWTDLVQGLMMVTALVMVPLVGIYELGGVSNLVSAVNQVSPDLLSLGLAAPTLGMVSALAWGFGYFGQPHILVRFMALRNPQEAISGRRIGITWMLLGVFGAGGTALVGIAMYSAKGHPLDNPETVFIALGQLLFHPIIAGFMLAAILAAIMSTISSQLLVTSSALVEDIYRGIRKKEFSGNNGVILGRAAVLIVAVVAALLALNPNNTILDLVGFAWAGFGASFGPIIILSLYWKRLTPAGAIWGMISGAATVVIWKQLTGGIFDLYEILPGFVVNLLVTMIISHLTYRPNPQVEAKFEAGNQAARRFASLAPSDS
ncbi:sodium/proline symporter [Boudabousia liubingyangii]|uniref:sodium/proline symporter PutP n=1 Tax=Boudabousia liubingyangii TaxID=1921764 RepID=UPI00093D3FBD|nr:sodium/proline symporter PutP [Boudabousia liubingyangii]OKL46316.1 sodium/proline symporter [Boudabousia liubingyangii]